MERRIGYALLLVSTPVFAFMWGQQTTITGYYVYDGGGSYITTPNNQNPDGCSSSQYLALNTDAPHFKEIYATVIAAQATGSTVVLNYDGCLGPYPKVIAVAVPRMW